MPAKAGIQYAVAPIVFTTPAAEYWIIRLRG